MATVRKINTKEKVYPGLCVISRKGFVAASWSSEDSWVKKSFYVSESSFSVKKQVLEIKI